MKMATHLPPGATPEQAGSSMAMAQGLCEKVKGMVAKAEEKSSSQSDSDSASDDGSDDSSVDLTKYAKDKKAMAKADKKNNKVKQLINNNEDAADKAIKSWQASEDAADDSESKDAVVTKAEDAVKQIDDHKSKAVKVQAVGKMPAKVANNLETEVHKYTSGEDADMKKAKLLCHMARKKVRDDDGAESTSQRKKAVQIAIKFCSDASKSVQTEVDSNDKAISKLAENAAKQYDLEVVKLKKSKKKKADSKVAKAEKNLFKQHIGKEGAVATTEEGLKDAKGEAMKKELHKQLEAAKVKVNKQMKKDEETVKKACKAAKAKINDLHGKNKADARAARLEKAIKFCRKAHSVIDKEKKTDYATIAKIQQQENAGIEKDVDEEETKKGRETSEEATASEEAAQKGADVGPNDDPAKSKIKPSKAALKAAKQEIAKDEAKDQKKITDPLDVHLFGKSDAKRTDKQTKTQAKAVAMCKRMKGKVQGMTSGTARVMAKHQAVDFCQSAKTLITKQTEAGKKTLKAGQAKAHKLSHKVDKLTKKQKILAMEKAATAQSDKIDKKQHDDIEAKKKALKAKAEQKIEKLALERERNIAIARMKKKKKHVTYMKKSAVKKQLKTNKECERVMANLKAMHKNTMAIDAVLGDFELMA